MIDVGHGQALPSDEGSPYSTILGLYLLILAFFIVLVSLSSIEETKARAVLESLSETFSSADRDPSGSATGEDGGLAARNLVQQEIADTVSALLRIARIEIVKPGRLMRVALPASAVFNDHRVAVRASAYPLLDRIIASLSNPPAGVRVDLEFALAESTSEPALTARRADSFARGMLAHGAPPDRISVAIVAQPPGQSWMTFRIRSGDDPPVLSAAGSQQ
jgi:flagellar motor protein MotB